MIIVMSPKASQQEIDNVIAKIEERGLHVHLSAGQSRTIIGVIGDKKVISGSTVAGADAAFHNVSLALAFHHEMKLDDIRVIMQRNRNARCHRCKMRKISKPRDLMFICC